MMKAIGWMMVCLTTCWVCTGMAEGTPALEKAIASELQLEIDNDEYSQLDAFRKIQASLHASDEDIRQVLVQYIQEHAQEADAGDWEATVGVCHALTQLRTYGSEEDAPFVGMIAEQHGGKIRAYGVWIYIELSKAASTDLLHRICADRRTNRLLVYLDMFRAYDAPSAPHRPEIVKFFEKRARKEEEASLANMIAGFLKSNDPGFEESELFKSMQERFEGRNGWRNGDGWRP